MSKLNVVLCFQKLHSIFELNVWIDEEQKFSNNEWIFRLLAQLAWSQKQSQTPYGAAGFCPATSHQRPHTFLGVRTVWQPKKFFACNVHKKYIL